MRNKIFISFSFLFLHFLFADAQTAYYPDTAWQVTKFTSVADTLLAYRGALFLLLAKQKNNFIKPNWK